MSDQLLWGTVTVLALITIGWLLFQKSSRTFQPRHASQLWSASPHALTYSLILVNSIIFALTLINSSLMEINPRILMNNGALYNGVLSNQEYWRLIAYAFLHGSILHFATNMLCIMAWSPLLEKRVGPAYLLVIYIASAIGGGLASVYGHTMPYYGIGASGAIAGILGALLCLTLLGKTDLTAQFFMVTIGLNAVLSAQAKVDWYAHLGGLIVGFVCCGLIDRIAVLNRHWLKCKFPEFVKFGFTIAAVFLIVVYWTAPQLAGGLTLWPLAGGIAVFLVTVKVVDLILAQTKGLAIAAFCTAGLYGALPLTLKLLPIDPFEPLCLKVQMFILGRPVLSGISSIVEATCRYTTLWPYFISVIASFTALWFLRLELWRGLNDVGFIANTLKAERNRRYGL